MLSFFYKDIAPMGLVVFGQGLAVPCVFQEFHLLVIVNLAIDGDEFSKGGVVGKGGYVDPSVEE